MEPATLANCIVEASCITWGISGGSRYACILSKAESLPPFAFSLLVLLYIQQLQLPIQNVNVNTTPTRGVHTPAVLVVIYISIIFHLHFCSCQNTKILHPHAMHGSCIKLQRQKQTERTADNDNGNTIWKIAIKHTSVRLAYASPS